MHCKQTLKERTKEGLFIGIFPTKPKIHLCLLPSLDFSVNLMAKKISSTFTNMPLNFWPSTQTVICAIILSKFLLTSNGPKITAVTRCQGLMKGGLSFPFAATSLSFQKFTLTQHTIRKYQNHRPTSSQFNILIFS